MITSLLLVDVHGLESLAGGQLVPDALVRDLSKPSSGATRQIAVQRAYCAVTVPAEQRAAMRDAGFEIVETAGADETLIQMTLDLADLSFGDVTYEEAMLLGGTSDYTALARLARERLMVVSVASHAHLPASLKALADALIDPDGLEVSKATPVAAPASTRPDAPLSAPAATPTTTPAPAPTAAPEKPTAPAAETKADKSQSPKGDDAKGDAWPDPKKGSILVAGTTSTSAAGLGLSALSRRTSPTTGTNGSAPSTFSSTAQPKAEPKQEPETETKAESKPDEKPAPKVEAKPASLDDDLAAALDEEIGAELEAELLGDLSPAKTNPDISAKTEFEPETKQGGTGETAQPSAASKPSETVTPSVEEDATLDDVFADLTADKLDIANTTSTAPAVEAEARAFSTATAKPAETSTTSVDAAVSPATTTPTLSNADADADVDELLSRLMSDDLASEPGTDSKTKLDVVPER
jgi:hypothetical protein